MKTYLKICGITNLADARYCAGAGADYLGFIQVKTSPRYIAPEEAKQIIEWVYGAEPVGVFANTDAEAVNQAAETAGFSFVQLHGEEPPGVCAEVARPVIKALHVHPETTIDDLRRLMDLYASHVRFFLLDTHHPAALGGTGRRFDWEKAAALAEDYPLFLAGGIDATNVAEAMGRVRPYGIDLSSRLEAEPGRKDFDKLAAFFDVWDTLQAPAGT